MREFAVLVQDRRVRLVQCDGELDHVGAAAVRSRLNGVSRQSTDVIILDLSRVTLVDRDALDILAETARSCTQADVGLVLSGLSPFTRRLLMVLGLDGAVPLVDDMVAAAKWAAAWAPAHPRPDTPRSPMLPPGPRRYEPTGPERPWYEWR